MAAILTENSIAGDHMVFDDLIARAYPNWRNMSPTVLLKRMVGDGVIQVDALFEQAISVVGRLGRDSREGRDFVDGSDAKKALTYKEVRNDRTTRRVAKISNIEGKEGLLRVIVGETLTGKTYYFRIPREAYEGLRSIRIYWNEDGTPKDGKWFDYQVNSFRALCK